MSLALGLFDPYLQVFDERTGKKSTAPMTFWSKFGEKVSKNKESRTSIDKIRRNCQILAGPERSQPEH